MVNVAQISQTDSHLAWTTIKLVGSFDGSLPEV